ncbi:unnamed protein product [marine sediment metagenome]|uniref:Uncharacterized protein n=1 Tax=marine sediment metagenome TaxID=412755 RepID=X1GF48_9ZZZZ
MNGKYIIGIVAIIGLTIIECVALYKEIDGQYLTIVVGAVCTVIGAVVGVRLSKPSVDTNE